MSLCVYVCICTLVLKGKMGDQSSLQACEKLFLYIKPFLLLNSSVDPWTKEWQLRQICLGVDLAYWTAVLKLSVVAHTCNLGTWKTKTEEFQISCKSGPHIKYLPQNQPKGKTSFWIFPIWMEQSGRDLIKEKKTPRIHWRLEDREG